MKNVSIGEFEYVLIELITENFPDTVVRILHGGDYVKDFVCELSKDGKRLEFSPYELYIKSKDYEETIESFLAEWEEVLR